MTYLDNDKRSNSSTEPFIAAPRANKEEIPLCDIKSLDYLAEEILHEMRFNGCSFDENGEWIEHDNDTRLNRYKEYIENAENNILEFRECKLFRELSMHDFCKLTVEDIQERYLADILPKVSAMMRKLSSDYICAELSPEISDDYLKDLFTIRWRDNAMLWIARFSKPDPTFEEAMQSPDKLTIEF